MSDDRYEVWVYQFAGDAPEHIGTAVSPDAARAMIGCWRRRMGRVCCDIVRRQP